MEMKKSPSTTSLDPSQTASKEVSETGAGAGAGAGGGKNQDRNGNGSVKRNSSDKKVRKSFLQLRVENNNKVNEKLNLDNI